MEEAPVVSASRALLVMWILIGGCSMEEAPVVSASRALLVMWILIGGCSMEEAPAVSASRALLVMWRTQHCAEQTRHLCSCGSPFRNTMSAQ